MKIRTIFYYIYIYIYIYIYVRVCVCVCVVFVSHQLNIMVIACLGMLLGSQEYEAFRISRQSAHKGGKFVSPKHRPL